MAQLFVPGQKPKAKRSLVHENVDWGVCLWKLEDGSYVKDDENNYANIAGKLNDPNCEKRLRDFIRAHGFDGGKPRWLPGSRQISDAEFDDEMERLRDGKTPDLAEQYRLLTGGW